MCKQLHIIRANLRYATDSKLEVSVLKLQHIGANI